MRAWPDCISILQANLMGVSTAGGGLTYETMRRADPTNSESSVASDISVANENNASPLVLATSLSPVVDDEVRTTFAQGIFFHRKYNVGLMIDCLIQATTWVAKKLLSWVKTICFGPGFKHALHHTLLRGKGGLKIVIK